MFETWRISAGQGACSGCGEEFAAREPFFSALLDEGDEFLRRDFCPRCWQQRPEEEFFCHWKTRHPEPDRKQRLDTDLMMQFFRRLEGAAEQRKRLFRFVLALYLLRRKELKLAEVERGGDEEALVFEQRSSEEQFRVENPGATEQQLEETAAGLSRLFDAEL